jgi:uncharacterized protein (TIGR00251 family)
MKPARLHLRVSPGATRSVIVGRHGEGWKVRVAAPPEDGRANAAVVRLIADAVSVSRDAVSVVSGHASKDKIVELAGIELGRVERRLTAAAAKVQV